MELNCIGRYCRVWRRLIDVVEFRTVVKGLIVGVCLKGLNEN